MDSSLVPWIALAAGFAVLLALDVLAHRRPHAPSLRESAVLSAVWIGVALAFVGVLLVWRGGDAAGEYLAGYLVEKSLSLDNVFVFALLFSYFAVPAALQYRVLFWGVVLAILLRAAFIAVGATLLANFHWVIYVFGAFLVLTGIRVARHSNIEIHPERNPVLRLMRRAVPMTEDYRGAHLFVREGGRRMATPLLAAFVLVATFDVIFAVDSVPAIFAITDDTFIVFAANAFSLLGLWALFFLLAQTMSRIAYLNVGLGAILVLVGTKMLAADLWKPPVWASLLAIVGILAATAIASRARSRREEEPAAEETPAREPVAAGR